MKEASINSVPSPDIEKKLTTSNEEFIANDQEIVEEALESAQVQKDMPLTSSKSDNMPTNILLESLSSNEQTTHIPNMNISQEIIDEPKEININEPPSKNENIDQTNNTELDSSSIQVNNANISTKTSDLYESQNNNVNVNNDNNVNNSDNSDNSNNNVNNVSNNIDINDNNNYNSEEFMRFEYGQTLQQPSSNITNSIRNSQINNNNNTIDNLSGNTDQIIDKEHHYRFHNHYPPNSQIENENNNSNNNDNKAPFSLRKLTDAEFQALPSGSRLFLGNLSTHSTSKKELYDVFSPYGEVFQISIKNSFGFIQYDNPERLEISHGKPRHHSPNQDIGTKPNFGRRHEKRWNQKSGNKNNWHNIKREYSPVRGHNTQTRSDRHYNKEDNERGNYHDQRTNNRSKPYRIPNRDYLERKQSRDNRPQSQDRTNDEFPLPRRQGNEVPECQIIALEEIDRNYLWQVEHAFKEANITVHTLHLSRKLQIQAVVRQMIVEGVRAVIFLERNLAINGRVNMQIFEHQRSQDNVKYDEYNNIKLGEAVGLLLRARDLSVSSVPVNIRPPDNNNILMTGQQILSPTQQTVPITEQLNAAANISPISLNNVNFAALANLLGIPPMQVIPPGTNLQHQPGFMPIQSHDFDVQRILGNLPANTSAIPNQQPYMQMPPHNLAQQPAPYNASMANQPNVGSPNVMPPNTLPQHQSQHAVPNLQQFPNQIPGSSNVSDLMAQFNNYNNQR
ncbi:18972_t:CDS:2 [Entrophospora sp. SA101]|nr:18972_t:CDS:2 [Entrophospora sp. SA101]